ncbi:MAG: SAM-dependent methyltransferase [Tumebacillaceae bacterium]
MTQPEQSVTRLIGTANHGFAQHAIEEVRRLAPVVKFSYLEPGEVFLIQTSASFDELADKLRAQPPIFLRHIQPVEVEMDIDRSRNDLEAFITFIQERTEFQAGEKVAIQVRKASNAKFEYTPYGVKEALDQMLVQIHNVEPVVQRPDKIISIYLTLDKMYYGVSAPADNISDWSGGMVRFQKEEGQVSRAKFKLLEAEETFDLDLSEFRRALDVGAAPGGWTSLLLDRGVKVTAVDPGDMHPSLLEDPNLTYLKKNASEVAFEQGSFDLLVCDMSWSPKQMAKLVTDLLDGLESGGTAIITVKLMHKKPFQTVKETVAAFGEEMELLRAKQLFHNREELTLYLKKR